MIEEFKDVAKHFGYKIKEVKVKEREPAQTVYLHKYI